MGQATSDGGGDWRCCRSSSLPRPDQSSDTIKIDFTAATSSSGTIGCRQASIEKAQYDGCSSCTIIKGTKREATPQDSPTLRLPRSLSAVDDDCLPCPSVVVTSVLSTSAAVVWSCPAAVVVWKLHIDVLLGDTPGLPDTYSIASFVVDAAKESFEIPAGTLQRGHGPYCVKVVAETEAHHLSNAGVSAAFFTVPEPPGLVSDLHIAASLGDKASSTSSLDVELKWAPPRDDGGSRIHEYEVTICSVSGPLRTFNSRECHACVTRCDFDVEGRRPVKAEVRARSAGGILGKVAFVEIPLRDTVAVGSPRCVRVSPRCGPLRDVFVSRAGSLEEPSAEPPVALDMQESASPWLGTGWESAFVVQASKGFEPTGDSQVRVRSGDLIQVLEQHSTGWTYCKNLSLEPKGPVESGQAISGWVPDWVVKAKNARSPASSKTTKLNVVTQGAAIAA